MMRPLAHVAFVFTITLCIACASIRGGLESPEVSLVDLEALPSDVFEQRFEIRLRIANPNEIALSGDGIDLTLDLNGQRLARALSSESFTIPRLGDDVVTLVGTTNLLGLFRQFALLSESGGRLDYVLHGRVLLADSMGWLRFSHKGSLLPD